MLSNKRHTPRDDIACCMQAVLSCAQSSSDSESELKIIERYCAVSLLLHRARENHFMRSVLHAL